jgi:DGQHR domain
MPNQKFSLELKAIKVHQPIGEFFLTAISHQSLREIAFADVRKLISGENEVDNYLGIQRTLSTSRVNEITRYVMTQNATFPTSIILAVDSKCAVWDEANHSLTLQEFLGDEDTPPITKAEIARILDGQHRLAGLRDVHVTEFEIPVAIFVGADIAEQATIFSTVNLAQTKVNRSLAYDLYDYAKRRSPLKSCHFIAVALDQSKESPLHGRIKRLGASTPGRVGEVLTQATVVESLLQYISKDPVKDADTIAKKLPAQQYNGTEAEKFFLRQLWLEEKDLEIAKLLYRYFQAVENKWPIAWNDLERKGNILPRTNGFKALMRFLRPACKAAVSETGHLPTYEQLEKVFESLNIPDNIFNIVTFPPGSSGESIFFKLLMEKVANRTQR